MRKVLVAMSLFAASVQVSPALATEATQAVVKAIAARDCVAAVRELNAALAGGSAEALMLGGAMFEQGLCLKQNTERASRLYVRAVDAGATSGRSRLAALYASPAGGPDKGAALWWGMQAGLPLPAACMVDTAIRGDAERFAQALGRWTLETLNACVYVTGVLATLDAEFVIKAAMPAQDSVTIDFRPATARMEVRLAQGSQALIDNAPRVVTTSNVVGANDVQQTATPEQNRTLQRLEERQALQKSADTIARDALIRFPKPASAMDDWRIQLVVEGVRPR